MECPAENPFVMARGTACCQHYLRSSACTSGLPGTPLEQVCGQTKPFPCICSMPSVSVIFRMMKAIAAFLGERY